MKNFAKKLCIIAVLTLIADGLLFFILGFFYRSTTTTDEYKLNTVTSTVNDEVLFMGSSRCHHHYVPSIISDTLETDVYNAGLWGMRNIYFQYGLLSNILERYIPKVICLEIHPIDYLQTPFSDTEKVEPLGPYINLSEGCDEVLKYAGLYYKYQLSRLYRYNSKLPNILVGNLSQRSFPGDKGFKQLDGQLDTTLAIVPEKFPFAADERKEHYLQLFIDKCKERGVELILLYSPMFATETDTQLLDIPARIAKKNGIRFINHYDLKGITGEPAYFHDYGHLNEDGAKRYSAVIASELKPYLKTIRNRQD